MTQYDFTKYIINSNNNYKSNIPLSTHYLNELRKLWYEQTIKTFTNSSLFNTFNNDISNFYEKMNLTLGNLLFDYTSKFINKINVFLNEFLDNSSYLWDEMDITLKNNIATLGECGWCLFALHEIPEKSKLKTNILPQASIIFRDDNEELDINNIDKVISRYFNKTILETINNNTKQNLKDQTDIKKFNLAIEYYKQNKFYNCIQLLCELIDSQSIKQELLDKKNNIYPENKVNVTQGYKAFSIVVRNHFSEFYNEKDFISRKSSERKATLNSFVYDNTFYVWNYGAVVINIAYPLLVLFEDSPWDIYPNKPKIFNRNWLAHGMYNYNDVKKSDCLKLFLLLRQLTELYIIID